MNATSRLAVADQGLLPGAFQRFPKNAWYIAAARVEVTRELLGRQIAGQAVVLYRRQNGEAVAMADPCPHRGYPLSKGKLVGDSVQCRYHGMIFNEAGQCTRIAGPGKPPDAMRARVYPLVEKWHWVWLWMGDPARADPASIPHVEHEDDPSYDHRFYFPMPFYGNFQLAHDNLLDATHASHLHAGLLDTEANNEFLAPPEVTIDGNTVTRIWNMPGFVPNKFIADHYHLVEGERYNRRVKAMNHLPCAVNIFNQFYEYTPEFGARRSGRLVSDTITAIGIVPASANRGYHFTAVSSSYPQQDNDKEMLARIIDQDIGAFESIQKLFEESPDTAMEISVRSDKLGVLSRRIIAAMVSKEEQESTGSPRFEAVQPESE